MIASLHEGCLGEWKGGGGGEELRRWALIGCDQKVGMERGVEGWVGREKGVKTEGGKYELIRCT